MSRIRIYVSLMAAALLIPRESTDLGKLEPVDTVSVYKEENKIVMETDTGAKGTGESVQAALQNMIDTTAGIIYLDTADYLLVRRETEELIPELGKYLKESVRICRTQAAVKVEDAAAFLEVHTPKVKLGDWKRTEKLPLLRITEGRMHLEEN